MYVPEIYQDDTAALGIIRNNPLALFVCDGPIAAHLPMVLETDGDDDLIGRVLLGHINRSNPQWAGLKNGDKALAVFHGPHGYISPAVYEKHPAAPTWNFTAVHVTGEITVADDPADVLPIITRTVEQLEGRFGVGWDMTGSLPYFHELLPHVAAFRLRVRAVDTICKLSQEQRPEQQERVIQWFENSDTGQHHQLARLMRDRSLGHTNPLVHR
ncbi:hypothetical protein Lesp02_07300 [Lentzea sp. NBRC 105346]|uniref:FMN-binding negative transcriptional regulator n=1 Tax=Lentzea sp. NBRC 105346 TaxID=3032205 RepID=UPI0024A03168|nr:FMN-binding negative transcriptional regulator [Lentzea sp. NBRC 105346]GLZ28540.1 hypothetical protein Lesp02_07300 [Lentzea sp. NBRC 105346]